MTNYEKEIALCEAASDPSSSVGWVRVERMISQELLGFQNYFTPQRVKELVEAERIVATIDARLGDGWTAELAQALNTSKEGVRDE